MDPSESFGFAEATASGNDLDLSLPFTNNAEIVLDSDGTDLSGAGVANSTPTLNGGQTASASEGQPGQLGSLGSAALSSPAQASGQSLMLYVVLSLVVVAAIVHFHKA